MYRISCPTCIWYAYARSRTPESISIIALNIVSNKINWFWAYYGCVTFDIHHLTLVQRGHSIFPEYSTSCICQYGLRASKWVQCAPNITIWTIGSLKTFSNVRVDRWKIHPSTFLEPTSRLFVIQFHSCELMPHIHVLWIVTYANEAS